MYVKTYAHTHWNGNNPNNGRLPQQYNTSGDFEPCMSTMYHVELNILFNYLNLPVLTDIF